MEISLASYIVTVLFFSVLLFVVMVFSKKPVSKKPDYLSIDELEETGWEIVDEIRRVGEEYGGKLVQAKKDIEQKMVQLENLETRLKHFDAFETKLEQKQRLIEDLYEKTKEEMQGNKQYTLLEEKLQENIAQQLKKEMEKIEEQQKVQELKKESPVQEPASVEDTPRTEKKKTSRAIEDKKGEVYRLHGEGKTIEEIAEMTDTHKGFVEVLLNMKKIQKNG